jgi:hypothetical protein
MSPHGLRIARNDNNQKRNASAMARRRSTPRAGDVLASGRTARADIHAISIVPAEARTIVARYSEAIERVRELARELRVDGWYTSDHTHYARVATYREDDSETLARRNRGAIDELSG